jgi:hypothetical protein
LTRNRRPGVILTRLSSDDKYEPDSSLQRLLDLDGEIWDVGDGYWVKIEVRKIEPTARKPHGINYSLCLFSPDDERLVCFDNAHPVKTGSGPAGKLSETNDHAHRGDRVEAYRYADAEALMTDFWAAVETALKEKGAQ